MLRIPRNRWLLVLAALEAAIGLAAPAAAQPMAREPRSRPQLRPVERTASAAPPAELPIPGTVREPDLERWQPYLRLPKQGMSEFLDGLLPETRGIDRDPPSAERVAELIDQLESNDFATRQQATQTLKGFGPIVRDALSAAAEKAQRGEADREVLKRIQLIERSWKPTADLAGQVGSTAEYLSLVTDDEAWALLRHRIAWSLQHDSVVGGRELWFLAVLQAVRRREREAADSFFVGLLNDTDERQAAWIVRALGLDLGRDDCPDLLLTAAAHPRPSVRAAALPLLADKTVRQEEIRRVLRHGLDDADAELRTAAAAVLWRDFEDEGGLQELLDAVAAEHAALSAQALQALGHPDVAGRVVPKDLIQALQPLLDGKNTTRRRMALKVIGSYQGEAVFSLLIASLGDADRGIVAEARLRLKSHPDFQESLRRLLDAAQNHPIDSVREQAGQLLAELGVAVPSTD